MVEPETFLNIDQVIERVGVQRTKIYDLIKKQEFPSPVKVGTLSRWPSSKISEWQKKVIAENG